MIEILRYQFGPLVGAAAQEIAQWQLIVILLFAVVMATTIHVFGHAWMADRLGDRTPRMQRRVSLNPFAHYDIVGLLMMVATMLVGFPMGWGRPIRTNPEAYKVGRRLGIAMVAAAGPLTNFAAAALLSIPARIMIAYLLRRGEVSELFLLAFITVIATILVNLSLFVFNLVPVGPLDATHILASALPTSIGETYRKFMMQWGSYVLLVLMASKAMPEFIGTMIRRLASLLIGIPF